MRKLLLLAAANFVLLSASLVGLYEYSPSPNFCRGCHFMRPYHESWRHSSHRKVNCLGCHLDPGTLNELRGKWKTLRQLASYLTGTYSSKPYAEVSDRSCLQQGCHQATHNPQQALYLGRGGRGVEAMPDPMSQIGMGCAACHVVPQHDPKEAKFFGQTFTASSLPCYACHGKRYEGFQRLFPRRLEEMLSFLGKGLDRERRFLASPSRGLAERDRFRLLTLLRDAGFNVRLVQEARGIHNPQYALELLQKARPVHNVELAEEAIRAIEKGAKGLK